MIRELGVDISVRKPNPVVTSVAFALELAAFLLLWLVVVFVATEVAYQLYDVFSGNNPGAQEHVSRGIGDAAFIVIFLGCLVIGVLFRASTLLFSAHDTNRALSSTAPALLYLRSFSSDESKPLLSQILARWFRSRSFFAPTGVLSAFTVEQVVANSLLGFKHIAVGRPGEPIQLPGASRIYVKGSDWQVVVENLMREAQAVLVHVDSTHPKVRGSGLAWEIEQIVSSGSLEKTVFLTVDGNGTALPFGAFAEILRAAGIAAAARAGQQQLAFLQHGSWSCVLRDHPLGPLDGLRGALAAISGLHPSFRAREGRLSPRWVRRVVTGTLALMLASPLALWWSDRLVTLTAAKTEGRLQSGQIVDAERASGDKVSQAAQKFGADSREYAIALRDHAIAQCARRAVPSEHDIYWMSRSGGTAKELKAALVEAERLLAKAGPADVELEKARNLLLLVRWLSNDGLTLAQKKEALSVTNVIAYHFDANLVRACFGAPEQLQREAKSVLQAEEMREQLEWASKQIEESRRWREQRHRSQLEQERFEREGYPK